MGYNRGASRVGPSGPPAWKRGVAVAPLYAAALLLSYLVLSAGVYWAGAARVPYGLEHGEGLVLADAVQLASGKSPYRTLDDYPFLVGNYPPLYLLANAMAIRMWGFSPLYGRLLSLLSLAVSAALVILIARRLEVPWLAAVLGALYYLAIPSVRASGPLVRVDMVAAALSFAGIAWLLSREDDMAVVGPAVCFAAALSAKHSMVAAPAAALVWLVWHDRRRAWRLALWTGGLTLGWLSACWAVFGSVFFLNIGPYTMGVPWMWTRLVDAWEIWLGVWYLPALVATVAFAAWALAKGGSRDRLVGLYGLAAAGTIVLLAKEGSSDFYLMEYSIAGSLVLACSLGRLLAAPRLQPLLIRFGTSLVVALALFLLQWPTDSLVLNHRLREARSLWSIDWESFEQKEELIISLIREVDGPVLAEEPFYLLAAGKPVLLNPFMMKWLAAAGRWDERRLIRDIASRHFALIQLNSFVFPPKGQRLTSLELMHYDITRDRFSPKVLRAIDLYYEVPRPKGDFRSRKLYMPKGY